jgi:hypothetical protein
MSKGRMTEQAQAMKGRIERVSARMDGRRDTERSTVSAYSPRRYKEKERDTHTLSPRPSRPPLGAALIFRFFAWRGEA